MTSAYMWSAVVMVVFFLIAVIAANLIMFKPNNPGVTKRRVWFWTLCIGSGIVSFLVNFIIASKIDVPSIQSKYQTASVIAAVSVIIVFIIAGFILSKVFHTKKIGTWF